MLIETEEAKRRKSIISVMGLQVFSTNIPVTLILSIYVSVKLF